MKMRVLVKTTLIVFSILLLSFESHAQQSVANLNPAHVVALEKFIGQRPQLEFLSEKEIDQQTLKDMRKNFGARLTPFYRVGDFNGDRLQDFAVILASKGAAPEDQGPGLAATHRYRHQLSVVIFNGQKNSGYRVAFEKKITAPLVCFLNQKSERRKRLYFAVYETDEHFIMTPAGTGYRVEYESH
jgi:hypothetical protein